MSRYELNKLTDIVMKTAKTVFDNEKFPVGVLAVRARRLADCYPRDNTAVGMYQFLNKRAAKSRDLFITRNELQNVYNKLFTTKNKFAQEFKTELGLVEDNKVTKMTRNPNEGYNIDTDYGRVVNPVLAEQLSAVLDKKPLNLYSGVAAKSAQKSCAYELNSHGALPKKINVVAGQSDILICKATYDTPKGQAHALIPVELKGDQALLPSMFLASAGFVSLNMDNLQIHLQATAGKQFKVNTQNLLQKISDVKNGKTSPVSSVEQMVMKVTASSETPATHDANAILYQEVDPVQIDVATPKLEEPKEFQGIGEYLSSSAGDAEFRFGKATVELGRKLIANELSQSGFSNSQVVVSDSGEDNIRYAIAIDNRFGFKVNTKIETRSNGSRVHLPKVLIAGGNIYEFSRDGLDSMLASANTDPVALAKTSPMYDEKPSDLVDKIRLAMQSQNYLAAEEALHVLKQSNNEQAYKSGYSLYIGGLNGKTAIEKSNCSMPVQTRASKYLTCSHTGLPLSKVYQDEYGHCRPLYRRGMENSSDGGGSFLTSKILFE